MKVFDFVCVDGHRFEGWFASAESFDAQHAAGDVRCPFCDASDVRRAPSAPRLNLGNDSEPVGPSTEPAFATLLTRLRRAINETEDVGARFAAEARRIHHEEAPARSIRGTATQDERRQLDEEGIETFTLALPPALTETLQ
jgi:hypothetical protein